MKQKKGSMHAGDDEVLIVARIADDGLLVHLSREVLKLPATFDAEFTWIGRIE